MVEKPMEEVVFPVEEAPEGGYTARALGVSIVTEADDLEALRRQVVDAVRCHFAEGPHHQPSGGMVCQSLRRFGSNVARVTDEGFADH